MNDASYRAAQRAYDNQLPEDHKHENPEECEHEFKVTKAKEVQGETLREYKCKLCGLVDHD